MNEKKFCSRCDQQLINVGKFWICPEHGEQKLDENPDTLNISLDKPVDLAVLVVKSRASRCKIISTGELITLHKVMNEVEGEIVTVMPSKVWRFKKTNYMSGEILSRKIDIPALQLTPLALRNEYLWNPEKEGWEKKEESPYLKSVLDFGPRFSYEMEQVIPFHDPDSFVDPITDAADSHKYGDYETAHKILEKVLAADLRCLDAHAHLGAWKFNKKTEYSVNLARKHYEVGVKIGELSLPADFKGFLPWIRVDNRPLLRCLHGYGLSLWRQGKLEEARKVFIKLLWLDPDDGLGAQGILMDIDSGKTWQQ